MAGEGCGQRRLERVLREKERKDSPAVKWQGPREGNDRAQRAAGMKSKRIQDCAGGTRPWTACPYSTTPAGLRWGRGTGTDRGILALVLQSPKKPE